MTRASPPTSGSVATRTSIRRPSTFSAVRPSCGMRRSAMSSSDMILMREIDAGDEAPRDAGRLGQDAVDAEADEQLAADGLEVDVGGALVDALGDERVDELDDRRLVGGLAQVDDLAAPSSVTASSTTMSSIWFRRPTSAPMSSCAATAARISWRVISEMSSIARTLPGSTIATSSVRSSRKPTGTAE